MAYLNGKRLYSSDFVSQTLSESVVFFFTGTIPTIGIAIAAIVARRYSFTQACTPHPARRGREKAGGGVGRKGKGVTRTASSGPGSGKQQLLPLKRHDISGL